MQRPESPDAWRLSNVFGTVCGVSNQWSPQEVNREAVHVRKLERVQLKEASLVLEHGSSSRFMNQSVYSLGNG